MFKVIEPFYDGKDNRYYYEKGSQYPRKGVDVKEERIAELMGDNGFGIQFIKEIATKDTPRVRRTPQKATK